ncbi:MAG: FAD-dependent oxidoreductase [Thermus sp.]|uniref:FAD-dependent oxidoreductase n=1 Tax=Thermus sp. TaxID=275 RepID=UPI0025FB69C9|nr:FAD-dependent oxidoreductase [Thermus sp.]MCS6868317.1 FAD-dependent oxidoreductase [Thermus sp.]MCS7218183.1 FAD-dependent oxidoreductase [Thermus sp.]MCX7850038.1 FAD-dependent oxidoreductase [Thermus sp.]MDW8017103.1 FAD-dependent oxidoreductase [Thermus sp.]MDW8356373.1 FAD-dependent oxidoreductase [Thermus sp.]
MRALAFLLFLGLALAQYDLVVYGATPQGVAAAVAGAQEGLKVLLLEPGRGVGGVLTQGWLATLDVAKDKEGLLQGGLFREFYRRLGQDPSFDAGRAEEVFWALLREAGVEVRLEEPLDRLEWDGPRLTQLFTPKGGYQAPYFLDATDTAELAFRAGASFTLGREDTGLDRRSMAATLVFRLEGVPWGVVFLALNYEGQVRRTGAGAWGRSGWGFGELVRGYIPSDPGRYALRGLNLARQDDGSLLVNALLLFGLEGADPQSLERARAEAALEAERVVAFLRERDPLIFGTARLAGVAPALYVRESRHLKALYRLRAEEVLLGRTFPDAVALGGYPLDGQAYYPGETPYLLGTPAPYGVPFRTLVPREFRNLLVVSQAAGFDSAAAFSARVAPLQMALGEAAGVAAALLRKAPQAGLLKVPLADFHELAGSPSGIEVLRQRLLERGARLSSPEKGQVEADKPGYREAVSLLRRGLFAGPYYLKGSLGLAEPIILGDFLANLEHYHRAKGPEERLRVVLKARELYREELQRPLKRATLNHILLALGEGRTQGGDPVTRGEAAQLLYRLLP